MFFNLIGPAICAACNFFGGVGVGYAYSDIGVSLNWVDRHTQVGKIDEDTLMVAATWEALHYGSFSVGPYVGRTFTPDGKGPKPIIVGGISIQWNL